MKIVFLMHVWAECIQNQASACKHIIAPILYFLDNVFFCPGNKKGSVILCMLWVHCLTLWHGDIRRSVFEAVSDETITAKRILSCYGRLP